MEAMEQEKTNGDEAKAHIISIFQKLTAGKDGKVQVSNVTVNEKPIPTTPTLKSVLKRVKNAKTGA
jgi:hypothetical protein